MIPTPPVPDKAEGSKCSQESRQHETLVIGFEN